MPLVQKRHVAFRTGGFLRFQVHWEDNDNPVVVVVVSASPPSVGNALMLEVDNMNMFTCRHVFIVRVYFDKSSMFATIPRVEIYVSLSPLVEK